MIKAAVITLTVLVAVTSGQWRQPTWGRASTYLGSYGATSGGAIGYNRWAQPAYAAPIAYSPIAHGAYARPIARVPQYGGYAGYAEDESPKPFNFGFSTVDEYGTQLSRQEVADGSGAVTGSYSYRDPVGIFRQVQYVADAAGFRANIDTNEPGVISHRPANAVYNVQ